MSTSQQLLADIGIRLYRVPDYHEPHGRLVTDAGALFVRDDLGERAELAVVLQALDHLLLPDGAATHSTDRSPRDRR